MSATINEIAQNAEKARAISDEAVVNQSSSEIANSSEQVKASADDLKRMAAELNTIVGSFKI